MCDGWHLKSATLAALRVRLPPSKFNAGRIPTWHASPMKYASLFHADPYHESSINRRWGWIESTLVDFFFFFYSVIYVTLLYIIYISRDRFLNAKVSLYLIEQLKFGRRWNRLFYPRPELKFLLTGCLCIYAKLEGIKKMHRLCRRMQNSIQTPFYLPFLFIDISKYTFVEIYSKFRISKRRMETSSRASGANFKTSTSS